MTEKAVIKNIKKYNDIRLARGLKLNEVPTTVRNGNNGISTEKFGRSWYMLPKGRAIFKTYGDTDNFFNSIRNLRLVNELLCYELAKQMNVPCAEYELASKGLNKGIVTYDVAKEGEKIVNLYDFYNIADNEYAQNSLSNFAKALEKLQYKGYTLDKQKMLKTYFKVALFDILTAQTDRHENNIILLIDKKNKTVRFSPIIDNEFSFNIVYIDEMLQKGPVINQSTFLSKLKEICCMLSLSEDNYKRNTNWYHYNLCEVIKIVKTNDEYAEIFKFMIKNMDMKNAINKVKRTGIVINKSYEKYLLFAERTLKQNVKKVLNSDIQLDDSYNFLNTSENSLTQ